jgi:type I restriction enzyme M protein
MNHSQHNTIVNFIWGIADDVLRDVYVRGKYRDVILPMTVIRRLDSLLEDSHDAVLAMKANLDKAGVSNQSAALAKAAGQPFYNTSPFTLKRLLDQPKKLKANFRDYLDGFSENVQEIISKFDFRRQLDKLDEADSLGQMVAKFVSPTINLGPNPVLDADGNEKLPGLTNHSMGYVFEELIRRFNEENNEEAGEHFTPREVVDLMARLLFEPIADKLTSSTYLLYDAACGTGGMLTVGEETLQGIARRQKKKVAIHLHGQEINAETYAIAKADLLLKGEGEEADNIKYGSTLSADGFPSLEFDFMLSNPPYGKSWKTDLDRICGGNKKDMSDPRFVVEHKSPYSQPGDEPELNLVTRTSDGQLMFLVNKLAKMKQKSKLGSRIAEVHNGSSLFTGDAGQGESNIRRWIIENDWLEAIVALPLNMFYNTGIATYIWVLANKKTEHRRGKVQLIDATQWFSKLRKNLGQKNCELKEADIQRIIDTFIEFKETEESKIFPNEAFGYWKVTVERPLRLKIDLTDPARQRFHEICGKAKEQPMANLVDRVAEKIGAKLHLNYNVFIDAAVEDAKEHNVKLTSKRLGIIQAALAEIDESAEPVIRKLTKLKKGESVPEGAERYGQYVVEEGGKQVLVEYEPDSDLRDTEQIPLLEDGGIEAFFDREVTPHISDAWIDRSKTAVGYEIPFTRHFYKYHPLRSLKDITADIRKLEEETDGLLEQITNGVA